MQKRTRVILALLLPVQYIVLKILLQFPEFVEHNYSQGIYPLLSKIPRYLFGWIPFSVGDIFYLLIAILAIRWIVLNVKRLKYEPLRFFVDILATVSIVYFMFHVLWGLNYYRVPLHETLSLERDYTTEQLVATTKRLIKKSNEMHRTLGYEDSVKIDLPYSQKEIFKKSLNGYENLSEEFPELAYHPKSIKKSGWSLGLTYMGYSGYYNPFSGEAQVNNLIKTYKFSVVSCHEMAHQLGYAAENEANFIATLATIKNDDPYFQYTGYIFALRYCVNEIARRDMDTYNELIATINPGILASYKEMRDFWDRYQNPFETFSKGFWDQFLKANNQSKGIMSYSYMVALVINYFEDRSF
ncbi:MAG: amino acid permease [Flavobacteriaceae bacterium]|nr:amino acid permease [Flavobacteriaceae bacterium]|tara:strand:+ start:72853 stop:73920 length:1068 start_codon:yes stop_codon:yes gene_type:complete